MKKAYLLFTLLFCTISLSFAQFVKYEEGYVITNDNLKIEGEIKITNAVHKAKKIVFVDKEGKKHRYSADDIQSYHTKNDAHISAKIEGHKHKVFLKQIITKHDDIFVFYYYHRPAKNTTNSPCTVILYGDDYITESNGKKIGSKTFKKEGDQFVLINHCEDTANTVIIHH
ncbi:MAG: hypothetical protein GY827_07080 [Cytophagales bacterium]|nr:hypothetical protein [Cytophagales bacterium]